MLSLGLPSLLKGSSSRRSLQTEKSESSSKEGEKPSRKEQSSGKKSDKEKSEGQGRLSVLMVRKRGKVSVV
jgi:dual specificity tyrosine-phosphorylation-regulated kinase 2/3/4